MYSLNLALKPGCKGEGDAVAWRPAQVSEGRTLSACPRQGQAHIHPSLGAKAKGILPWCFIQACKAILAKCLHLIRISTDRALLCSLSFISSTTIEWSLEKFTSSPFGLLCLKNELVISWSITALKHIVFPGEKALVCVTWSYWPCSFNWKGPNKWYLSSL